MKSTFLLGLLVSALSLANALPPEVASLIPASIDIRNSQYAYAKKEINQLIKSCGVGVFQGIQAEGARNKCSFQVALDDLFFLPPWKKTGLLHEKDWAHKDGVVWIQPKPIDVPVNFDLRDYMTGGIPEIKKQNCGDCWAWSTHHGLEISRAVHDGKTYDHSVQTVLSCSNKGSCGGGYMSAVGFLTHGLPYEEDFTYKGNNARCKYSSADIEQGWDAKIIAAPYIGSSKDYSRAKMKKDGSFRVTSLSEMAQAMVEWKAPLVVTVDAYSISGAGVYDRCSSINSGGNHMVAIVGWEMWNGKLVAHVWNSWGKSHGEDGVSRIVWDCGNGKLNHGLGVSARVVQYKAECQTPYPAQKAKHIVSEVDGGVEIGFVQEKGTTCSWLPQEGLENPNSCLTRANPKVSTEYHLTASNECGTASSMTLVQVPGPAKNSGKKTIQTVFGKIKER